MDPYVLFCADSGAPILKNTQLISNHSPDLVVHIAWLSECAHVNGMDERSVRPWLPNACANGQDKPSCCREEP